MRLYSLFGHSLRNALAMPTLELTREQVPKPSLEERDNSPHKEEPYSPSRCPETTTRPLSNRTAVKPVVDEMLQVLAGSDLVHELVLVPVHTRQGTNVREYILKCVGQLERVNVAQPELDVRINDEFGKSEDFTAKVECISET